MARSVKITTPIPTLEEFGEKIGLSKTRLKSLTPMVVVRRSQGDYAIKRLGSEKASAVSPTQQGAIERARTLHPNATILIERVRETSGSEKRWRRA